jgi:coatomer protein complex subunit gamma
LNDNDDEVRDRATFYLSILEKDTQNAPTLITGDIHVPMVNLERALLDYRKNPTATPFDIKSVSFVVTAPAPAAAAQGAGKGKGPVVAPKGPSASPVLAQRGGEDKQEMYAAMLASVPQLSALNMGQLFRSSSKPVELTESETEYVVHAIKHVFTNGYIVVQFNCTNTLAEQLLENVTVKVDVSGLKGAKVEATAPLASLPYGANASPVYVAIRLPSDRPYSSGTLQTTLKFTSKEIDPSTGEPDDSGYDDEYKLEDLEVTTSDFMQKTFVPNFNEKWEAVGDEFEVVETYSLSTMKSLPVVLYSCGTRDYRFLGNASV